MAWFKYLASLLHIFASLFDLLRGSRHRRIGRLEAEHAQADQDLRMLRKAADACRAGAERARKELGLQIIPACHLRWLESLPGKPA